MKFENKFTQHFLSGEIRTEDKFLEHVRVRANEIMKKCDNVPSMRTSNAVLFAVTETRRTGDTHTESVKFQVRENARTHAQIEQVTVYDTYRNKDGILVSENSEGMSFDTKEKSGKYIHTQDRSKKSTHSFKYYAVPFFGRKLVSNVEKTESPIQEIINDL